MTMLPVLYHSISTGNGPTVDCVIVKLLSAAVREMSQTVREAAKARGLSRPVQEGRDLQGQS